ncbi:cytochrome c maturation protein CcmE [Rhodobacteraceae bacterium NNCM2]|nr:cytochrome c maturation protein CcmE [Coraliihabitans acroporae]
MAVGLKKKRRIQMLVLGAVLLAGSAGLISVAFRDAIVFFFSPTELLAEERSPTQLLRVGGLVVDGSWKRGEGKTNVFAVTDGNGTIEVAYTGVLPDLFREGQGVVAEGYLQNGRFTASEVLAKHDENYMPKEVADALKEQGHFRDTDN